MEELAFFIAGIGAGITGYTILIEISFGRLIRTPCDYCKCHCLGPYGIISPAPPKRKINQKAKDRDKRMEKKGWK